MRAPRMRFSVRWAVAAMLLGAIMAVLAAIERRDHLRSKVAIAGAETAYRDAKLVRELAEVAVKDYAEGTYRRELATAEAEIKQAEDELSGVATDATAVLEWAERIRSKRYLLLIRGVPSRESAVKRATFAVEQAKSKKFVLERYTRVKTLGNLNNQVAKTWMDELTKKGAYDKSKATPVGFIGRVMQRQ